MESAGTLNYQFINYETGKLETESVSADALETVSSLDELMGRVDTFIQSVNLGETAQLRYVFTDGNAVVLRIDARTGFSFDEADPNNKVNRDLEGRIEHVKEGKSLRIGDLERVDARGSRVDSTTTTTRSVCDDGSIINFSRRLEDSFFLFSRQEGNS